MAINHVRDLSAGRDRHRCYPRSVLLCPPDSDHTPSSSAFSDMAESCDRARRRHAHVNAVKHKHCAVQASTTLGDGGSGVADWQERVGDRWYRRSCCRLVQKCSRIRKSAVITVFYFFAFFFPSFFSIFCFSFFHLLLFYSFCFSLSPVCDRRGCQVSGCVPASIHPIINHRILFCRAEDEEEAQEKINKALHNNYNCMTFFSSQVAGAWLTECPILPPRSQSWTGRLSRAENGCSSR